VPLSLKEVAKHLGCYLGAIVSLVGARWSLCTV